MLKNSTLAETVTKLSSRPIAREAVSRSCKEDIMVIRQLKDGSSIVSTQENHSELSAQFAAHWATRILPGSALMRPRCSARLTTIAATGNGKAIRRRTCRRDVPKHTGKRSRLLSRWNFGCRRATVEWVSSQDRYAGLLVSMHRNGLWQNRYDTFSSPRQDSAKEARRFKP